MSRIIEHGSTNQRVRCRVLDSDGLPYEGLAYNATGIAVFFQRVGSTATSISLLNGTGLNDDHADGKWNEIGDGWYQLDSPDGAFSSGVDSPLFYGSATGYTFIFESVTLVTSLTASDIVDEWETQSQADPTGFHVNVKEVNGTSVSGPDDFKATGFSTLTAAGVRTAIGMASADLDTQLGVITADTNELQTDWANGGRLDTLLDAAASGGGGGSSSVQGRVLEANIVSEVLQAEIVSG